MNKKLMAVSIILGFVMSVMPAYGALVVPTPGNTTFSRAGATYIIHYKCGLDSEWGVTHGIEVRVHNNKKTDQYVYIKILDEIVGAGKWSYSSGYRWTVNPDALLLWRCEDIQGALSMTGLYVRGVLVISHPGATTDLDVIATEIVITSSPFAYNEQTIYVPGVRVSNIPTPCVLPAGHTTGCETLPL